MFACSSTDGGYFISRNVLVCQLKQCRVRRLRNPPHKSLSCADQQKNQSLQFVRTIMLRKWILRCISGLGEWIFSKALSKYEPQPRLSIEETGFPSVQEHLSVEESDTKNKYELINPPRSFKNHVVGIPESVDFINAEGIVSSSMPQKTCKDHQESIGHPGTQGQPVQAYLLPTEESMRLEMGTCSTPQQQESDGLGNSPQEKKKKRRRRKRKSLTTKNEEVLPKTMKNPHPGLGLKETCILLLMMISHFPITYGQATCEQNFNTSHPIEPPVAFREGIDLIGTSGQLLPCPQMTTIKRNISVCALHSSSITILFTADMLGVYYMEYGKHDAVPEQIELRAEGNTRNVTPFSTGAANPAVFITLPIIAIIAAAAVVCWRKYRGQTSTKEPRISGSNENSSLSITPASSMANGEDTSGTVSVELGLLMPTMEEVSCAQPTQGSG